MKKRILAALLAAILVVGLLPMAALAAEGEAPTPTWSYTCVVEPQYDGMYNRFSEGLIDTEKDGKWGYIDVEGNVVIPFEYDIAYAFSEGLAIVGKATQNGEETYYRLGFIDKENHLTWFERNASEDIYKSIYLPEDDTGIHRFSCGYVAFPIYAETGESWGIGGYGTSRLFGTDGKEKFGDTGDGIDDGWGPNPHYVITENISLEWAPLTETLNVQTGERNVGISDYEPEIIDGATFADWSISPFNQGLAPVRFLWWLDDWDTDNRVRYGVVDTNGNLVIQPKYTDFYQDGNWNEGEAPYTLFDQSTGLASMADETGKWGAINKQGETVIPFTYDSLQTFRCGLAAFKKDGKYGFIDAQNNVVIPAQYSLAIGFNAQTELALVSMDGEKCFFIDKEGQAIDVGDIPIAANYYITEKENGTLSITRPGEYFVIEQNGKYGIGRLQRTDGTTKALTKSMFTVDTAAVTYTGSPITKTVTGKDGDKDLVLDTDYTVTYADNTNVGTAKITIEGKGNYTGTLEYTFTIKAKPSGGGSTGGGGSTKPSKPVEPEKPPVEPENPPVEPEKPATPASEKFGDVAKDSWYEAGVTYVTDKGLFQGVSEGVFAPNTNMTRAMLMTVLARLDGQETAGGATWYAKAMDWAKEQGISDGSAPDGNVTREQLVTMLYRYAKPEKTEGGLDQFADGASVSTWAKEAMEWAVANGIVTGKGGARLDPQGTATRAEVATIIQRFAEKAEQ